jgi:hypothetical protein
MITEELDISRDYMILTENLRMKKVCAMMVTKNLTVLSVEFLGKILIFALEHPAYSPSHMT